MTDEAYWEIKPESTSYRFLSRWHEEYKKHHRDKHLYSKYWSAADVASDFCTYYRHVTLTILKLLLWGFLAFVCIPESIFQAIMWHVTGALSEPVNIVGNVSLFVVTCIGWLEILVAIVFLICIPLNWIWENIVVSPVFWIIEKIDNWAANGSTPKPSIIKTWFESKKFKICKLVKYSN